MLFVSVFHKHVLSCCSRSDKRNIVLVLSLCYLIWSGWFRYYVDYKHFVVNDDPVRPI